MFVNKHRFLAEDPHHCMISVLKCKLISTAFRHKCKTNAHPTCFERQIFNLGDILSGNRYFIQLKSGHHLFLYLFVVAIK